jgi:hypothetical protein
MKDRKLATKNKVLLQRINHRLLSLKTLHCITPFIFSPADAS